MKYDWLEIREKIIYACEQTYTELKITGINKKDISVYTDLFDRIIAVRNGQIFLDGLSKEIRPALQDMYIDHKNYLGSVKTLHNSLDAFLKKILIMVNMFSYTELDEKGITLLPLINKTAKFGQTFTAGNIDVLSTFNGECGLVSMVYKSRNLVHSSPDWSEEQCLNKARHVLSFYVLIISLFKSQLEGSRPDLFVQGVQFFDEKNEFIYDYLNFTSSSNEVKNQFLHSLIFQTIYENPNINKENLFSRISKQLSDSITKESFDRTIRNLQIKKAIDVLSSSDVIVLLDETRDKIANAKKSFQDSFARLKSDVFSEMEAYGISDKTDAIIDEMKLLFEKDIDLCLSLESEDQNPPEQTISDYGNKFKDKLKEFGCPEISVDDLYRSLINIHRYNDVVVRLTLGKKYSEISINDKNIIPSYNTERIVFLDTQILLYLLCYSTAFPEYKDNTFFRVAKNLMGLRKDNNVILKTSNLYVDEVVNHTRRALQLIPFTEIPKLDAYKLSTNVFYSYYYYLFKHNQLPENINGFADFLYELLEVSENDIPESGYPHLITNTIKTILEEDFDIEIVDIPQYSVAKKNESDKVFSLYLDKNDSRTDEARGRDSVFGLYLFDKKQQTEGLPFFLTWDRTFYGYRKKYHTLYHAHEPVCWYLFGPARFINHIDLLNLKINSECLTDEFLSLVETDDIKPKTRTVVEQINRVIDKIGTTDRRERRKMISNIMSVENFEGGEDRLMEPDSFQTTKNIIESIEWIIDTFKSDDRKDESKVAMLRSDIIFKSMIDYLSENIKVVIDDKSILQKYIDGLYATYNTAE